LGAPKRVKGGGLRAQEVPTVLSGRNVFEGVHGLFLWGVGRNGAEEREKR